MEEEWISTDILCAGGGIAGLMAAIRAAELGARVVIAEKGNVKYSGCGRMGNDHFETYIPEIHGSDRDAWIEELLRTAKGEILISKDLLRAQFRKAFDIVQLWDNWGIPMSFLSGPPDDAHQVWGPFSEGNYSQAGAGAGCYHFESGHGV